jgi:hypothetical protein
LHFQNQEKFANVWQVLTIETVMSVGFTILLFVCGNKQRNQRNGVSRFKEKCLRKAQHYGSSLKEEKPLQFVIPLTLLPKNHNLFCEGGLKRECEKKESL